MSPIAFHTPAIDTSSFIDLFESRLGDSLLELDQEVRPYAQSAALAGGKRIRPQLVYLFSNSEDSVSDSVLNASVVLELVHLATLIHDDILDEAQMRRKLPAMHQEIGAHSALLLGDALFGYALELASRFPTTKVCAVVAEATRKTCSGEIRQTFARGRTNLSLDEYIGFINDKTGELFKASCLLGAYLSGANESLIEKAGKFGLCLGISYQVYDDLMDAFMPQDKCDKTVGADWLTGKFTLPMIFLHQEATPDEILELNEFFCSMDKQSTFDSSNLRVIELLNKYHVLDRSIEYLDQHLSHTKLIIDEFPDESLRSKLIGFLSNFSDKLSLVRSLKTSNFLAV
jgi:geranylgeranyl pyrophosphate synthase